MASRPGCQSADVILGCFSRLRRGTMSFGDNRCDAVERHSPVRPGDHRCGAQRLSSAAAAMRAVRRVGEKDMHCKPIRVNRTGEKDMHCKPSPFRPDSLQKQLAHLCSKRVTIISGRSVACPFYPRQAATEPGPRFGARACWRAPS
jgi:hypothetical protein